MTSASHQTPATSQSSSHVTEQTFLDHVLELRTRLFWVVGSIIAASALGYAIQNQLMAILRRPLGNEQLFYLTPIGGLNFIIKVSIYFGILVSVPVIVYHLYRYFEPLMPPHRQRSVLRYFIFSILLAAAGISFAYFISLPAALHFLTSLHIAHVTAMLTVDSYLTFVVVYLLGAAALFQIPLILLIINNITPLKPGHLMRYQRHVFVGSFIIAAIISPTPDMFNQTILAVPIIAMYQVGVMLVWWKNRRRPRTRVKAAAEEEILELPPLRQAEPVPVEEPRQVVPPPATPVVATPRPAATVRDFSVQPTTPTPAARPKIRPPLRPPARRALVPDRPVRLERPRGFGSIDGIISTG